MLASDWSEKVVLAICVFTLIEAVVSVDIFRDRRLTAPFITAGSWARAIRQKPFYKRDYLVRLGQECDGKPAIIVADAWETDFDYHIRKGTLSLRKQVIAGPDERKIVGFTDSSDSCLMVARDAAYETEVLKAWHDKGYALKIERALYRRLFDRYTIQDEADPRASVAFSFFSLEGAQQP
jgi:hypothetical protein